MTIHIEQFNQIGSEIDQLLDESSNYLIHYSSKYLEFISKVIPSVEIICFSYRDESKLKGFLPLAIKEDPVLGTVANSLPYFGSHGGVFVGAPDINTKTQISKAVLSSLWDYCKERKIVSITLVENPFHPTMQDLYLSLGLKLVDDRIGQLTRLPKPTAVNPEAELFSSFHVKTRNAIRKGQKYFGCFVERNDDAALIWLQDVHERSISSMRGVSKSLAHFLTIRDVFGENQRVYVCEINGVPVAGILLLLYNNTVEYFTPVVEDDFKDKQILSALIFEAMLVLSKEGYCLWNWGGTWRTQEGVYRFKSRWGSIDKVYRYFNYLENKDFADVPRKELAAAFPFFYLFKY